MTQSVALSHNSKTGHQPIVNVNHHTNYFHSQDYH